MLTGSQAHMTSASFSLDPQTFTAFGDHNGRFASSFLPNREKKGKYVLAFGS